MPFLSRNPLRYSPSVCLALPSSVLPFTTTGNENSKVLLLGSVAVAVMICPAATRVEMGDGEGNEALGIGRYCEGAEQLPALAEAGGVGAGVGEEL
jgi:hypothetical protein